MLWRLWLIIPRSSVTLGYIDWSNGTEKVSSCLSSIERKFSKSCEADDKSFLFPILFSSMIWLNSEKDKCLDKIESTFNTLEAFEAEFSSKILGSNFRQWRLEVKHSASLLGEEKL